MAIQAEIQSMPPLATTSPVTAVKITSDITRGFSSWKKSSGWAVEIGEAAVDRVMGLLKAEGRPFI